MRAILAGLPATESGDAIRMLLLTGARLGEVLGMRWDQLDAHGRDLDQARRQHEAAPRAPGAAGPGRRRGDPQRPRWANWCSAARTAGP